MATCYQTLTVAECNQVLSVCNGLVLSHVWRSVEPCVFLELGRLSRERRQNNPNGRLTFMIQCDWRIEKARSIQVGSGFSSKRIDRQLATTLGVAVGSVAISGAVPEVSMVLADGRRFCTFTNWDSQPQWSIGFNDCSLFPMNPLWKGIDVSPWIAVRAGRVQVEYCYDHTKARARTVVKNLGFVER